MFEVYAKNFNEIHSNWGIWKDVDGYQCACHTCPGMHVNEKGAQEMGYHVVDMTWTCMRCKEKAPQDIVDVYELLSIKTDDRKYDDA